MINNVIIRNAITIKLNLVKSEIIILLWSPFYDND